MLKIIVNEGPRTPREPAREIPILGPKTSLGGPLGARLGGPLIDKYL